MRVSIIVADNRVYVDGESVEVDLSSLAGKIRAVQWGQQSPNSGHVELPDYQNIPIASLEEFMPFVQAAQLKIDAAAQAVQSSAYAAGGFINALVAEIGE